MAPIRWRALCEPETFPVSSLTQTPPEISNPSRSLSGPDRANGVTVKPCPSTAATARSSRSTSSTYRWSDQPAPRATR